MWRFLLRIAFVFSLIALFAYCGTSDNSPGEQAQIPASNATVTFVGSTWSNVEFKHAEHSDRYHGECIKCHDHEPIAGKTHWYCRECHTAGQDREKLCSPVPEHGCIMTQCDNCHKAQVPPKAPPQANDCQRCHTKGQISGVDTQLPTVPTGLTATAVSPSQIDLSWTASTDNMGVAGYKIYRGGLDIKHVTGISTSDTGLSASTQYCYRVAAYDAANNVSAQSTEPCATTLPDTQTPTVPTGLTATAVSSTLTNLSWTASTDNVAVAGYRIYRGGVLHKDVPGTGISTTDTVPSNTRYCYQVAAYDGANQESNKSTQACASSTVASGTQLVIQDSVSQASKVDHWTLALSTSGTIIIDVEAWEACNSRISWGKNLPTDFFGDGDSNNNLEADIFLFKQDGTLVAGCVGHGSGRSGIPAAVSCAGPGSHSTRSGHNSYLSVSIPVGTYILAIGSADLSQADAWAGVNTDTNGSYWTNFDPYPAPGKVLYNKYRIKIYFN